jgi:hypothetical protein
MLIHKFQYFNNKGRRRIKMNDRNKINFRNNMLQMARNNGRRIRINKKRINSNDNRLGWQ